MIENNETLSFGDIEFSYEIIRSNRKTISIIVEPDETIIVRAPKDLPDEKIREKIYKKRKWIAEKIQKSREIVKPVPKKRELVSGEKVKLKNKLIRLKIYPVQQKKTNLIFESNILHIFVNKDLSEDKRKEEIKKVLLKWYKEQALDIISKRVQKYAKYLDEKPKDIKVRDQQLRWGSCTKEGILLFNWRIVMAPVSAIDYIVIHELCHLKESSHTPKYWALVESLFPEYRKWKEWLRINGLTLDLQFK